MLPGDRLAVGHCLQECFSTGGVLGVFQLLRQIEIVPADDAVRDEPLARFGRGVAIGHFNVADLLSLRAVFGGVRGAFRIPSLTLLLMNKGLWSAVLGIDKDNVLRISAWRIDRKKHYRSFENLG